ncbi:unnamed protein product [Calypogeia fissa]
MKFSADMDLCCRIGDLGEVWKPVEERFARVGRRGWKHCCGKGEEDNDLVAARLCSTILSRKANFEALLPGSSLRKLKAWVGYCWTVARQ